MRVNRTLQSPKWMKTDVAVSRTCHVIYTRRCYSIYRVSIYFFHHWNLRDRKKIRVSRDASKMTDVTFSRFPFFLIKIFLKRYARLCHALNAQKRNVINGSDLATINLAWRKKNSTKQNTLQRWISLREVGITRVGIRREIIIWRADACGAVVFRRWAALLCLSSFRSGILGFLHSWQIYFRVYIYGRRERRFPLFSYPLIRKKISPRILGNRQINIVYLFSQT